MSGAIREPAGARGRVVGTGFVSRKVLITEGENVGKAGWIQFEELRPAD